jgi:hypothetical protein
LKLFFSHLELTFKAQTTLKLANEMMKQSHDMNKTLMLVTFTTLVKKRGPKFSCGLFDFDWKLVFAVSGEIISMSAGPRGNLL